MSVQTIEQQEAWIAEKQKMFQPQTLTVAEPTTQPQQTETEIQAEIRQLESTNAELVAAADPDVVLPSVPDGPGEDKLAALLEVNRILTDSINQEFEPEPEKPKFGTGLAVPLPVQVPSLWVDENQVDIDTGKKINLTPEAQELLKQRLEERRAEKAEEFITEYDKQPEPHSYYAMTAEEYERESEKEYPVYVLSKQPGPAWDDSVLYG